MMIGCIIRDMWCHFFFYKMPRKNVRDKSKGEREEVVRGSVRGSGKSGEEGGGATEINSLANLQKKGRSY